MRVKFCVFFYISTYINKRPLHYLVGEDPHQKLMHIRQDDKWNIGTELNWMQQSITSSRLLLIVKI
jgi:hypothetical protein